MIFTARSGNTLGEYAVMIGLLVLVSIGATKLLGNSIQALFSSPEASLASQPVQDMVSLKFGGTGTGGVGVASVAGQAKAGTVSNGKLSDQLVSEGVSAGTNATSVDGNTGTPTVMRSLGLAQKIEEMAEQEADPALKEKLMRIAAQAYFLSAGEASLEYGQNPGSNPQLQALANLVEDPNNPSAGDPAMALRTIQHKMSQVNEKTREYLSDPAASAQDKAAIQQLTQQMNAMFASNYEPKILAIKQSAEYSRYIKLPPLKNTEDGIDAITPVAKALLGTEHTDENGTVVVKTTVRHGVRIEEKANQ